MTKVGTRSSYTTTREWEGMIRSAIAMGRLKLVTVNDVIPKLNGSVKVQLSSSEVPDFTDEVNRGATWLDEVDPGWWRAIDTSKLNLDDENMCVLGQTWAHYARKNDLPVQTHNRYRAFVGRFWPGARNTDTPAQHGFSMSPDVIRWANWQGSISGAGGIAIMPALWERLTKTWLVLIQTRQESESEEKRKLVLELEGLRHEQIADRLLEERAER